MTDKPAFDPSQPFEAVAAKPPFDPSQPFEAAKPGVLADVGKAALTGTAKGAISIPGFGGDTTELLSRASKAAGDYVGGKLGFEPSPDLAPQKIPTSGDIQKSVESVTGEFPKPQTVPGKFTEAIMANAPAAVAGPGGLVARAANVVVPAVASEAAGEASAGTKFEPMMRFLGGLFGNGAQGIARSRAAAPERMVRAATAGVTPAEFDAATALQQRAAATGIPLSGPEAVQAATNSATRLGDVQRVVENSAGGGTQTARFYSERPGQVDAATGRTLDTIAPQSAAPSTLGPQAAEAATNELDQVRRNINTATRPAYQAAENHVLAPADFDPIAQSPAFQASLHRLRNDEVLGPEYAHQPDNSVAVIDAVTKDMRDRGVALGNATNPGFSSQTAGRYTEGSHQARDIARDPAQGGIQAYDDALTAQEQARRQNLNPLEQGPLGRVAAATDTRGAANAVLPPKPLTGGANELVDAITRLERQQPGIGASLVRQRLADQYDSSAGRLVGGENQYGGARFAKDIAGTPQAETNLNAVTDSLRVGPWQSAGREAPSVKLVRSGREYHILGQNGDILAKADMGIVNIDGRKLAQIDDIYTPALEGATTQAGHDAAITASRNVLGTGQMREVMRQFQEMHPDVEGFTGNRVSGARNAGKMNADNIQNITIPFGAARTTPLTPPPSDLQNLVEVLRATGMRKPQGSATAFNQQLNHELSTPPISAEIVAAAKSGGLTIPTGVRDRAKRAWLGRGTGQLADLFLAPDSVEQMRGISQRAAQTPMSDAMLRQIFETPGEVNRGR